MINKFFLITLLLIAFIFGVDLVPPAFAALPPGNAVKDPYAILRNALPIEQKELREIQHKLEGTSDLVRGSRWPAVNKAVSSSQFRLANSKKEILNSIP